MASTQLPAVLIVDDTPENLDILKAALKRDYKVLIANSGALCLQIASHDPHPDLILLDIMMPDMDGYAVIRRLQENASTRSIPVIFVTALSDAIDEMKGLNLGAVDYISKPFSVPIVQARVRIHLALRAAQTEIAEHNTSLLEERELIQEVILLMRDERDFDKRNIRYLMSSVDKTNGDVLLSAFTPDGQQWVLVGDIAGHGPVAALAIPLVSQIFYRQAGQGGVAGDLLNELNQAMFEKLPAVIYMPYVFVEISADRGCLRIWNGGLPGCLMFEPDRESVYFSSMTFPMGLCADYRFNGDGFQLAEFPKDGRLWIFTDGLSELPGKTNQRLGCEGVVALATGLDRDEELTRLWREFEAYYGSSQFPDDMTLVELSA
jgi:DNA-binding response OmpR family regulator